MTAGTKTMRLSEEWTAHQATVKARSDGRLPAGVRYHASSFEVVPGTTRTPAQVRAEARRLYGPPAWEVR